MEKCSEKLNHNALGGFGFTSAPATWASPTLQLPLIRLTRLQKRVRGIHPWAASPFGEERGSPFVFFLVNEKMNKIRFSHEPKIPIIHQRREKMQKDEMSVKNTLLVICLNSGP
jgi:hypothetical protein